MFQKYMLTSQHAAPGLWETSDGYTTN